MESNNKRWKPSVRCSLWGHTTAADLRYAVEIHKKIVTFAKSLLVKSEFDETIILQGYHIMKVLYEDCL